MAALFNKPDQNLQFAIPNEGELFRNFADDRNQFLYKRQGNQVFHTQAPAGYDVKSLQGYNMGDVGTAFAGAGKEANYRAYDPNLFSNASQSGGNVNVAVDPNLQKYLGAAQQQGVPLAQANLQGLPNIAPQQTPQQIAAQNVPKQLQPQLSTSMTENGKIAGIGGNTIPSLTSSTPNPTAISQGSAGVASSQQQTIQDSIQRLISLQDTMMKSGAPSTSLAELDRQIGLQQRALTDLTPIGLLGTQPGLQNVGITEGALERNVATQREPIARALSDLLMSRSYLGQIQQQEQAYYQQQVQGTQQILQLQQALASLNQPKILQESLDPDTGIYTQVVQDPVTGKIATRTTQGTEVSPGSNLGEYKKVLNLAIQYPSAGIKIGQPATTDSLQTALGKVARMSSGSISNLGINPEIQKDVEKQFALDKQTIDSAYESIKGILAKYETTPETVTTEIIKDMTDPDAESIGKALARIQQPDIARQGGDPGNALAPTGWVEKMKQAIRSQTGRKYLSSKIFDAISTAKALHDQRIKELSAIISTAPPIKSNTATTVSKDTQINYTKTLDNILLNYGK